MYGDFLVPNNTNIDNAMTTGTGAKWEKFYEYTFEDSHTESFEFPMDLDGTPLNLNGVMFTIAYPNNIKNTMVRSFIINDESTIFFNEQVSEGGEQSYTTGKLIIHNGLLEIERYTNSYSYNPSTISARSLPRFIDKITSFKFTTNSQYIYPANCTITFYVLRGI